ncbi:g-patch domain-containing protein [Ophiostoma piceae UAMH 11346]|uniref:Protein SQS1 n=1 Tax=Ophiostoma piceae (strain UAMH 11346) TaxID=1262450 RepID=S3BWB2_OPHP1|nr:g-patch domain-containing protein [Ophiostoma piceae UAMH 11346]
MAKKKKGPFGKKGGRVLKGPVNFASAPPTNTQNSTSSYAANKRRPQPYNRSADVDMDAPPREQSAMMQQAYNTRKNTSHWDQSTRLRDQPIIFISAGFIEPAKQLQSITKPNPNSSADGAAQPEPGTDSIANNDDLVPDATKATAPDDLSQVQAQNPLLLQDVEDVEDIEDETIQDAFFEDVQGGQDVQDVQNARDDDDADVVSDSSEEVILFKGRGALKPAATRPALAAMPTVPEHAMRDLHLGYSPAPSAQLKEPTPMPSQEAASEPVVSAVPELAPATSLSSIAAPDPDRLAHLIVDSGDEGGSDAVIDDYIDNMEADELSDMLKYLGGNRRTNRRTLGGTHNDIVVDALESSDEDGKDDEDEGGEEDEEAYIRWDAEENGIEGDSSDSSDELRDDWPLAEDINDEEFARLLAKQEELGLGSEELILFDDVAAGSKKGKRVSRDAKQKQRKQSKAAPWKELIGGSIRGPDGSFPSAEAVADAFDQLELMGRQGGFDFELSDSELDTTLQAAWQKDRARKKEKKKAREELRVQGLLGKYGNPEDPRVKYPNGMEFEDLKTEFQLFLLGTENNVALPPMDAHARKIIHEIAYRFNITSKSIGSGDQRRPSLVRKKGTIRYNEAQFNAVFAKYRRRFFPRLDSKRGGPGPSKAGSGRGSGETAAVVRNGEVVGGSAPEIGQANKGREMLEKMGWSIGMALGAMDNKGMTQPIEHVVKRSKAGLG